MVSWNVNGVRAVLKKGFEESVAGLGADILCLQETKARPEQVDLPLSLSGYQSFWCSAEKAGYSGTCVLTKVAPVEVSYGIGVDEHDREGRVITVEYDEFYLVNVYTPNAQNGLKRLAYRQQWDEDFREYVAGLDRVKPVIVCGDLNVAHQEIDLARPKENRKSAGFSDEERAGFSALLEAGFVDTFRHCHPDVGEAYTWWSYRGGARQRNVGWRIDYFCTSARWSGRIGEAAIHPEIHGSDHCPVSLTVR